MRQYVFRNQKRAYFQTESIAQLFMRTLVNNMRYYAGLTNVDNGWVVCWGQNKPYPRHGVSCTPVIKP